MRGFEFYDDEPDETYLELVGFPDANYEASAFRRLDEIKAENAATQRQQEPATV